VGGHGHTVDLIAGGPGVDQAGNIVLSTVNGGDIDVKRVTVHSTGDSAVHALFSAHAAGNFSAAALIDVEAVAQGHGAQVADAQIDITAGNAVTLHGFRAIASASEQGGGGNVAALAGADLHARTVNDQGNASVAAHMAGHSGFSFDAQANLSVAAS